MTTILMTVVWNARLMMFYKLDSTPSHVLNKVRNEKQKRSVDMTGAGTPGVQGGVGKLALLNRPHGLTQDSSGAIYFADRDNHKIRKIE